MKTLVIILIIVILAAGYLYWRLRPYVKMVRQFFGAVRNAQGVGRGDEPARREEKSAAEHLVRCSSCGTWLPVTRAVSLGKAGAYFCSHQCLERGADLQGRPRKSAS